MTFTNMDKGRPGVWVNFVEAAKAAVEGSDGVVAIIKNNYGETATPGQIYAFSSMREPTEVLGKTNVADIARTFEGGATKVIVFTQPAEAVDYSAAQTALELQFFEAVTFDHALEADEVADWKAWLLAREEDDARHELFYGVASDTDVSGGIARSTVNQSEFVTNIINAPKFGDETLASYEIAPFVAGAFASTPLSQSITYRKVANATDVNVRLTNAQVLQAMASGAIVFEYTGRDVRIIRGITTSGTSLKRVAIKHTIAREWKYLIEEKYIGKVPNGPNERLSMRADLTDYLMLFESQGVIEAGTWYVNVKPGPEKQQVIIEAFMRDLETMEEVYITIGLGA